MSVGKKTSVMLARGWPGEFRRTVRDADGKNVKDEAGNDRVLKFSPGQPVELSADELEAVRSDIGTALHISRVDTDAKPVAKPDGKATAEFVKQTADLKARAVAADAANDPDAPKPAERATHAAHADTSRKDIEAKAKK